MKNFKKILTAGALTLLLTGCAGIAGSTGSSSDNNTIRIAATAVPHYQILQQARPIIAELGYTLVIQEVDDFVTPNLFLLEGDVDANFFQHRPFLSNFNDNHGSDLVPVFGVHFEPLRLYAGRLDSLEDLPTGGISIAIPDDPVNRARALQLLEAQGLLELTPGLGLTATPNDIAYNPHNITVSYVAAPTLPALLPDVDFAIINGNFALQGGVLDRAIDGAGEAEDSPAAIEFTNFVVVNGADQNASWVSALVTALQSPEIADFIWSQYEGRIVPQQILP